MSDSHTIHVSFLTPDTGLAEAVARAMGAGFEMRASNELKFETVDATLEWSHVLLIDIRTNVGEELRRSCTAVNGQD